MEPFHLLLHSGTSTRVRGETQIGPYENVNLRS